MKPLFKSRAPLSEQSVRNPRNIVSCSLGSERGKGFSKVVELAGETKHATAIIKIIDHLIQIADGPFDIRDLRISHGSYRSASDVSSVGGVITE